MSSYSIIWTIWAQVTNNKSKNYDFFKNAYPNFLYVVLTETVHSPVNKKLRLFCDRN